MNQSNHETIKFVGGNASDDLSPAAGTQVSSAIDTLGFNDAVIAVYVGTQSGGSTADITVTECDTSGGTYTAITGAVFAQITSANDLTVHQGRISLNGRKRYLKISNVVGTATAELAILVALCNPVNAPVTLLNTNAFNLDPS